MFNGKPQIDPFTLEIIKESLVAIGDEMFIATARTSMSPIIYETLDYATGIFDADGNLITQGNGVAGFLGTLTFAVKAVLEKFANDLAPGDIMITNDPYAGGGTHLSDVSLVAPIFFEGRLVAFSANKAHWTEVGGMAPGSWTTNSTDIWQEGLQFPNIKLYVKGVPVPGLEELIRVNVRTPDMSIGDMNAQIASLRIAERRFVELCERYGVETVHQSVEALLDYGEERTRQALQQIPYGVYEASDWIDDDGLSDESYEMRVKVTVTDDKFSCDFTGSHAMVRGPINAGRTGLESAVRVVFKALTDPSIPANEGCFRPLEVICPEGTVATAVRPAPVSTYWETMIFCADLVWKALSPVVPNRLPMGHFLSVCGTIVAGIHPDTGELFILVEPQAGGWGAGVDKDGENALVCIGDGETYVIPVEVCETRYGVLVDQFSLNIAEGGAGRYRGGRGLIRDYRITADEAYVSGTFGRFKQPPWGMNGGKKGSPNYMQMLHADGSSKTFGKTARYHLKRGEVARLVTGTGGGYGDPMTRPEADVVRDVRDGYLTLEMAEKEYAIAVDARSGAARSLRGQQRRNGAESKPAASSVDHLKAGEKIDAILSIIRGETSASAVALRVNVERAEVEGWVKQFLSAGEGALRKSEQAEIGELRTMVRELAGELASLRRSLRDGG